MLRDDTSSSEKARKAVRNAVKRALVEIKNKAPGMAQFINDKTITLGHHVTYTPSENDPVWVYSKEKDTP